MELKVWVDAIQRIVCGISEQTTCQEVIYALAHATGKTGRFVLVEKWRTSERSLSPHDKPLELLFKWGEYSSDVQFVLHCLEDVNAAGAAVAVTTAKSPKFPTKFEQKPFGAESAPTPKPAPESVATPVPKPYFVDTSRPAPESGTLRPSAGAGAGAAAHYQQHARFGSELPRNLAQEQTTVLGHTASGGAYNNGASRQHGYRRQNGANLTVLSQSAHEHLMSAPFFGVNSNNSGGSCMESSFSSSTSTADLHNVSGQSSSLSSGGGSRRHPVPPSPATQIRSHNNNNFALNNNNNSRIASPVRRPPPPSYEQVMNNRRNNYSSLLITPPLTAQSSRSGTPVNQPYAGIPSSGHWPAPAAMSREQLLKIVESQHALINQQENKIRGLDNLLDEEQTKIVATEKQYYERDLDKMQKELQQLEVRRVHIKQNVEELRRQDLDGHVTAARQQSVALATENRSFVEKTNNLDAQLGQKRQIVEKLQVELSRDGDLLSSPLSLLSIDQNFDQSIVDLEEKIRDRKKTIDNLEATLAKESSLERLTVSLNNLRQLQQSSTVVVEGHKSPHSLSSSASSSPLVNIMDRAKSPSVVPPLFKETTPGVWV